MERLVNMELDAMFDAWSSWEGASTAAYESAELPSEGWEPNSRQRRIMQAIKSRGGTSLSELCLTEEEQLEVGRMLCRPKSKGGRRKGSTMRDDLVLAALQADWVREIWRREYPGKDGRRHRHPKAEAIVVRRMCREGFFMELLPCWPVDAKDIEKALPEILRQLGGHRNHNTVKSRRFLR